MLQLGLYDKLLMIPLFTGMSKNELERIVEKTKFLFRKVEKGQYVVRQEEICARLVFQLDGCLRVETLADDHGYTVLEEQAGCHILQPECAFGLRQRFTSSYKALTACYLISIDKNETLRLASDSLIFRLNLINILSTSLQKQRRKAWRRVPRSLEERIVRFFVDHSVHPTGRKIFKIKMERLAEEINGSRLDVSRCLNTLQCKGLVGLHRGIIDVHALEQLS